MRILAPVDGTTVHASFAEAELCSARWGPRFEKQLPSETVRRLRSTPGTSWSEEDRRLAIDGLESYRPGFFRSVTNLGAIWTDATVSPAEVPGLRVTAGSWWGGLSPKWDLPTLLDSFLAGKDTPEGDSAKRVSDLAKTFDESKCRGRPILVGKTVDGPFTILEGTTRLLAILTRSRSGLSVPDPISVYVGLTPRYAEWIFRGSE
jgi:hypothetical protein